MGLHELTLVALHENRHGLLSVVSFDCSRGKAKGAYSKVTWRGGCDGEHDVTPPNENDLDLMKFCHGWCVVSEQIGVLGKPFKINMFTLVIEHPNVMNVQKETL